MGRAILLFSSGGDRESISQEVAALFPDDKCIIESWDAEQIDTAEMTVLLRRLSLRFMGHRVTVITHADQLSLLVQSKLLKPVEEFLQDQSIVLVTDKPSSLLETLRSRFEEHRNLELLLPDGRDLLVRDLLIGPLTKVFSFTASLDIDQIRTLLKAVDVSLQARVSSGTVPEALLARWIAERSRCEAFPSRVTIEALMLTMRDIFTVKEK